MRLLDIVAQDRKPLVIETRAHPRSIVMSGPSDFASQVAGCPLRFVAADSLTRVCAELAFSGGDRLAGCLDLLRIPAPALWIEWSDAIHQAVISECNIVVRNDSDAVGRQVGLLLRASPCGRVAMARTFWSTSNPTGGFGAVMSPLETHISLDDRFEPLVSPDAMLRREFASVRCDDAGVAQLLERVRFRFDEKWCAYYRDSGMDSASREQVVQRCLAGVAHDVPLILAFFLLLNAKGATRPVPVEREQLNRRRQEKHRPALLDHVEVHVSLPGRSSERSEDGLAAMARRPPRLHGVRGHLVRREDRIFWRTPHLRGNARQGVVRSRTVCLSFSRAG
jgi:hypothetical protein